MKVTTRAVFASVIFLDDGEIELLICAPDKTKVLCIPVDAPTAWALAARFGVPAGAEE